MQPLVFGELVPNTLIRAGRPRFLAPSSEGGSCLGSVKAAWCSLPSPLL